ncbi:MAG: calcium-binding protein [Hyphomicrobiales bacterium]
MIDLLGLTTYNTHRIFAENYAKNKGYNAGQTNAFVHAYVSAMLTQDYGSFIAKTVGDYRENNTTRDYYKGGNDYRMDTFRDLYNNREGRNIGEYVKTIDSGNEEITASLVDKALSDGDLIESINVKHPDPRIPDIEDAPQNRSDLTKNGKFNGFSDDFDREDVPGSWKPPTSGPGTPPYPGGPSYPGGHGPDSPFGTPDAPRGPSWGDPGPFRDPPPSPLVLDLDGDGVEIVALAKSKAFFDLTIDRFSERTAWISADDGFLAIDRNGNGRIDDRGELFGAVDLTKAQRANGFTELAKLDSNKDGVIDARDAAFAQLRVWRDRDGDGYTDQGELQTLAQLAITSISVRPTYVNQAVGNDWISHVATFTTGTGAAARTGTVADVWFETDPMLSVYKYGEPVELSLAAAILPDLKGYGLLPNLRVSMQERPDLMAAVQSLVTSAGTLSADEFRSSFEAMLFKWAEVEDAVPGSRGPLVDAKHLALMEKLYGTVWKSTVNRPEAWANASKLLNENYKEILDSLTAKFVVQVPVASLLAMIVAGATNDALEAAIPKLPFLEFASLGYDLTNDRIIGAMDSAIAAILAQANAHDGPRLEALTSFVDSMHLMRSFNVDLSGSPEEHRATVLDLLAKAGAEGQWRALAEAALNEEAIHFGATTSDQPYDLVRDTFVGMEGDDYLDGGKGSDTYIWARGDGNDTIDDFSGQSDRIIFSGVKENDITIERDFSNVRLVVRGEGGGSVYIPMYAFNLTTSFSSPAIEHFVFEDAIWTKDTLRQKTLESQITRGKDVIYGFDGDDVLRGGGGDDLLYGGNGNDTYFWSRGEGNDQISDQGYSMNDRLVFTNVTSDAISVRWANPYTSSDVVLRVTGPGAGSVILRREFVSYPEELGVEQVSFSNGISWNKQQLLQQLWLESATTSRDDTITGYATDDMIRGGAGNDSLSGAGGNDRLIGGYGNDRLTGGIGSDTFVFGKEFGNDTITDFVNGEDRIEMPKGFFKTFDTLLAGATQVGADLLIRTSPADSILLKNFKLADFDASDVLLV